MEETVCSGDSTMEKTHMAVLPCKYISDEYGMIQHILGVHVPSVIYLTYRMLFS